MPFCHGGFVAFGGCAVSCADPVACSSTTATIASAVARRPCDGISAGFAAWCAGIGSSERDADCSPPALVEWPVHVEREPDRGARRPDRKAQRPSISGRCEEEQRSEAGCPAREVVLDQRGQATKHFLSMRSFESKQVV